MVEKVDVSTLTVEELTTHATALRAEVERLGRGSELARRKLLEAIYLEEIVARRGGALSPAQELGW